MFFDIFHLFFKFFILYLSIVAVSEHLGHADVEQTLNTYAHMMPDDRSIIVKVLQSINE